MRGYQLRLLLLSLGAVVLIVASAFFADWFVIHVGGTDAHVDLRNFRVCAPQCMTRSIGESNGMYPALATIAFWAALPLFVVILTQAGAKLLSGVAYQGLVKLGTGLGAVVFFTAFGAGYLVAPEDTSVAGFALFTVDRMWGPLCMVLGSVAGMIAVRYAMTDGYDDDVGEYRPVVIPKPGDSRDGTTRLPVTPLSVNKLPTPAGPSTSPARTKSPSEPPMIARTTSQLDPRSKAPSQAPIASSDLPARARTSSSGPVDVSARLGAAPLDVAIRPPLPEPEHIPEDQIAVAPESGLVIRKRTPSSAPLGEQSLPLPPEIGFSVRTRPPSIAPPPMMGSVASALGVPPPSALRGRVQYAVTTAAFSSTGITATREDGLSKLIKWTDVVGIVARRLPQTAPFDGLSFVDIVSSAGSTMRLMPATEIVGQTLVPDHTERARALVNLLASQALDAKLDSATKAFANGTSKAPQLKDEKTLATHDARLA